MTGGLATARLSIRRANPADLDTVVALRLALLREECRNTASGRLRAGVTRRAVATSLGITVTGGTVHAEGDLDFRGTLAVDREAPVGFTSIRLSFELDTEASEEQVATLLRLTERYCVVYQTLAHPIEVSASAGVTG